jgi:hypothetical protein
LGDVVPGPPCPPELRRAPPVRSYEVRDHQRVGGRIGRAAHATSSQGDGPMGDAERNLALVKRAVSFWSMMEQAGRC